MPVVELRLAHRAASDEDEDRYDIVSGEGTVVGNLHTWSNSDGERGIAGIGVPPELLRRGYGRGAIEALFRSDPSLQCLSGESTAGGEPFWEALGCRWLAEHHDGTYRDFELDRIRVLEAGE